MPDKKKCKVCGKEYSSYGISSHINHSHEITVEEYVEKYGEFRKSKLEEMGGNRDIQKIKCEECGEEYSSAGMHTHLTHTHNMKVEEYVEKHGEYRKKQKNRKERKENSDYKCEICGEVLVSDRQLSFHVRKKHDISKEEYVLEHIFGGEHPKCECGCGRNVKILSHEPYRRQYISGHNSKGENNPMYGKSHSRKTKEKMFRKKFESLCDRLRNENLKPKFGFDDYNGNENYRPHTTYEFECLDCSQTFESEIRRSRIPTCPNCQSNCRSKFEREVANFVESLNVDHVENDRTILSNNRELDIYVPDSDLAIECDGLYYHGEVYGNKSKNYHLNKTEECEDRGIQLIHVFEDEWINKPKVVKSVIKAKLGKIENIVYARNCKIRSVSSDLEREFLNSNHLMGYNASKTAYGLYNNGDLLSITTFGSNRFTNDDSKELIRQCTIKNVVVVGGFSKLMSHYIENHDPQRIISYSDRRYSSCLSNSHEDIGFELDSKSDPGYWYFRQRDKRFHRYNFTKSNIIEKYGGDPEKTEFENMVEMGYDRIWDCGHLKYVWS